MGRRKFGRVVAREKLSFEVMFSVRWRAPRVRGLRKQGTAAIRHCLDSMFCSCQSCKARAARAKIVRRLFVCVCVCVLALALELVHAHVYRARASHGIFSDNKPHLPECC